MPLVNCCDSKVVAWKKQSRSKIDDGEMVTLSELVVFHGLLPFQVKNQEAFGGEIYNLESVFWSHFFHSF